MNENAPKLKVGERVLNELPKVIGSHLFAYLVMACFAPAVAGLVLIKKQHPVAGTIVLLLWAFFHVTLLAHLRRCDAIRFRISIPCTAAVLVAAYVAIFWEVAANVG